MSSNDESSVWVPGANDCHFTWKLDEIVKVKIRVGAKSQVEKLRRKLTKLERPSTLRKSTDWRRFLIQLTLAFELARTEEMEKVLEALQIIEELSLDLLESQADTYILAYKKALECIAFSLLHHIYTILNEPTKAEEASAKIPKIDADDNRNRAALLGFHAWVLGHYGYHSCDLQIEQLTRRAVELDPEQALWHLSHGSCLNRMRHLNKLTDHGPTDEEIRELTDAYDMTEDLLVQSESALYRASVHRDLAIECQKRKKFKESYEHYRLQKNFHGEAYDLNPDDLTIAAKCAKGMLWGPPRQARFDKAFEITTYVLEKKPNQKTANETMSLLHKKEGKLDLALEHSKIAAKRGSFGAFMSCIDIMLEMNQSFCAESLFDEMLEIFRSSGYRLQIHLNASMFYLLFRADILKSVDHISHVLNDSESTSIISGEIVFSSWFRKDSKVDILKLLHNQISVVLSDNILMREIEENRHVLEEQKDKIECFCPMLKGVQKDTRMLGDIVHRFGNFNAKRYFKRF